jgi:excisionase family DNA binding protein
MADALVPSPALPEFLTVDEFAELLRVSRCTAYRALEAGGVAGALKVCGSWRISRSVLLQSFAAKTPGMPRGRR